MTEEQKQEIARLYASPNRWDNMRAANLEKWGWAKAPSTENQG